jgi:hypothetical protein
MRINSEFRDYYDSVQSEGQDQSLVYQRHKRTDDLISYSFPHYTVSRYSNTEHFPFSVDSYAIGFCGKVYLCLELLAGQPYANKLYMSKEDREKIRYCYTLQDLDKAVEEFCDDDQKEYFHRKKNAGSYASNRRQFERQLELGIEKQTDSRYEKYFIDQQCPVFVAHYEPKYEKGGYKLTRAGTIDYHAPLKFYDFMKVFPPFQAFQEINMWLSNQAVPIKPIPEIDDVTMAEAKGFDKYSFRKAPTKKR